MDLQFYHKNWRFKKFSAFLSVSLFHKRKSEIIEGTWEQQTHNPDSRLLGKAWRQIVTKRWKKQKKKIEKSGNKVKPPFQMRTHCIDVYSTCVLVFANHWFDRKHDPDIFQKYVCRNFSVANKPRSEIEKKVGHQIWFCLHFSRLSNYKVSKFWIF